MIGLNHEDFERITGLTDHFTAELCFFQFLNALKFDCPRNWEQKLIALGRLVEERRRMHEEDMKLDAQREEAFERREAKMYDRECP